MRRASFLLFLLMSGLHALAQVRLGVRAGVNTSEFSVSEKLWERENQKGFLVGVMLDVDLPLPLLSLELGLLYDNRKISCETLDAELEKTLHLLSVPIHAKAGIGLERVAKVFVFTGPQLAFNSKEEKIWHGTYSLAATQLNWDIGAGLQILHNLQLAYTYNVALAPTAEVNTESVYYKVRHNRLHDKVHQLSFTYFF